MNRNPTPLRHRTEQQKFEEIAAKLERLSLRSGALACTAKDNLVPHARHNSCRD